MRCFLLEIIANCGLSTFRVAVAAIVWLLAICAAQAQNLDTTKVSANSLLDTARLNSIALRRFDVLIHTAQFENRMAAGSDQLSQWTRLVVDLETKRCMFCSFVDRMHIINHEDAPPTTEHIQVLASNLVSSLECCWREWPGPVVRRPHRDFLKEIGERNAPLFHFAGVLPYPARSGPYFTLGRIVNPHSDVEKFWSVMRSRWNAARLVLDPSGAGKLTLAPVQHETTGQAFTVFEELSFDAEHQLPVARRMILEINGDRIPQTNEFCSWKEADGIYVPESLYADRANSTTFNGKVIKFDCSTTADIHWFTINEKLDDSLFDESVLHDPQRVRKLTDAKASGATSLIKQ